MKMATKNAYGWPSLLHTLPPLADLLFAEMQACRRRHQELARSAIVGLGKSRRSASVYQCPSCDIRQLGIQRCEDCRTFMAHLGIGELYPH